MNHEGESHFFPVYSLLLPYMWVSLVAQLVKNLPAMQETWVRSLGWEDPLEKEKDTHSVFWPGEFLGLKESDMTVLLSLSYLEKINPSGTLVSL